MHDNRNRFMVPNVAGPARLVPLDALLTEEFSLWPSGISRSADDCMRS